MLVVVAVVIALAVGVAGTLLALRLLAGSRLEAARRDAALLLDEAQREARRRGARPASRRASRRSSCAPTSRRSSASGATRS